MAIHVFLTLLICFLTAERSHASLTSPPIVTSSLTYVVDTTGSMYYDMQQLKVVNGWILDRTIAQFPCGDRQYTLVEFNDPSFGQVKMTKSIDEFKSFISNLYAYDGGDCPEFAMNGLKVALENSPDRSIILVLTDASAKDYDDISLLNSIRSLITTKQSQVLFLTTGHCWDVNEPSFLIYREMASLSYGHHFQIDISDLGKVFNYLDYTLSIPINNVVKVFYKYYNVLTHCDDFTVTADFKTLLVIIDGQITSITISGPGYPTPKTIVSEIWGSLYEINIPAKGTWNICVVSNSPHALQVEGLTATNDCTPVPDTCEDCHSNAICDTFPGVIKCTCKDGFIGNGLLCEDIDECEYPWLNNCTSVEYCVNTIGSYKCLCPPGYTKGTGNTCVDIDECSSPDLNKCHPLAICINTVGSYICQCPPGVPGNGFDCGPYPDPCATDVCGHGMECTTDGSTYSCSDPCVSHTVLDEPWRSTSRNLYVSSRCDNDKEGWYRFIGTGGVRIPERCIQTNSCGTGAPMWLNGPHPASTDGIVNRTACAHWAGDCCQWSSTIQIKACPGRYYVYKLNRTPACDLAYCTDSRSVNCNCSCTDDEVCRHEPGFHGCYCKDNRTINSFLDLLPTVECGVKSMKTTFRKCELRALEVDVVRNLKLINDKCFTVLNDYITNTYSVLSTLQAGTCGMTLTTNKTHAFYTISFEFHIELGLIIRDKLITTATCIYPLDMRLSLETAVKPIISTTIIDVSGTGELKAHMAVFNSSDYLYPYQGSEIELYTHTVIYIGVFLEGPDPSQYAMVLKDCYATPSNDPNDPIKYYIIQNRCPNRYDGTVEVQANGVDIAAKFSFEVFAFVGDYDRVYMHCDIYACIKSLDTCEPKCKTRAMDETTEDTARITIGPFVRQAPTTKPKATEKAPTTEPSSAACGTHSSWTVLLMLTSVVMFFGKP
uniref:Uromodulin n=1 Tax=Xenopus tropicalis TaxID=8364 RepID=A0A6I8Q5U1_XENTR